MDICRNSTSSLKMKRTTGVNAAATISVKTTSSSSKGIQVSTASQKSDGVKPAKK
jgi:hypothetical protein